MLRNQARWHRTATAAVAHLLDAEAAPCELYSRALAAAEPPVLRPGRHTTSGLGPGREREPGCQPGGDFDR